MTHSKSPCVHIFDPTATGSGELEKLGKRGKKNVAFQGKNHFVAPMFLFFFNIGNKGKISVSTTGFLTETIFSI